ncbi:MAG: erythromycin biosynthesis sensory transduction protein eryC1 [Phycisphaerales bacterium]|nr:erythromycin biosynthesis sensory transduction protein eryC1 [Phycisphaerales bacterium]
MGAPGQRARDAGAPAWHHAHQQRDPARDPRVARGDWCRLVREPAPARMGLRDRPQRRPRTRHPEETMSDAPIPFCDLSRAHGPIRADIDAAIRACIDSSAFLRGPQTQAFEEEWAAFCGQRHAVTCNSGTDALTLAATALNLRAATVPSNTLPLTAIGLPRAGVTVTICDVDDDGWPAPPVAPAPHPPPAPLVPVLLYGRLPRPAEPASALYDAAHAHGWKPPPRALAAWSFYPTKTLGALGDGGAVTTDDAALAQTMRDLCGRDDQLRDRRQLTSRMDEMQAAVLRVKLRHLPEWIAMRQQIGARYDRAFAQLGINLRGPSLHHLYCIRVPDREGLQRTLTARGIGSKVHWEMPLHRQEGPWQASGATCPGADAWCASVLSLPCYPGLREDEIDRVAAAVGEHLGGGGGRQIAVELALAAGQFAAELALAERQICPARASGTPVVWIRHRDNADSGALSGNPTEPIMAPC